MAVPTSPEKAKKPYVHEEFPTTVYAVKAPKGKPVRSAAELADLVAADGDGVWFASPAEVPTPEAPPEVDYQARIAELEAKVADLRSVNGDLVAALAVKKPEKAKPEPEPKAEKPADVKKG